MMKIKMLYIIGQIAVLAICVSAFFSLVFDLSWRYYPLGFLIGYTLADVIQRMTKVLI